MQGVKQEERKVPLAPREKIKPEHCARCRREPVNKEGVLCEGCWPAIREQFAKHYPNLSAPDLDKQIRYILAGGL